jgi:hypothetical protein
VREINGVSFARSGASNCHFKVDCSTQPANRAGWGFRTQVTHSLAVAVRGKILPFPPTLSPDAAKRNPGKFSATPAAGAQVQPKNPGFHCITSGLRSLGPTGIDADEALVFATQQFIEAFKHIETPGAPA